MAMSSNNPRLRALVAAVVLTLLGTGMAATTTPSSAAPAPAPAPAERAGASYKVASLNLHNKLGVRAMRHDIRKVKRAGATVIGLQERRKTKAQVKAALPAGWKLAMPTTADGSDDNPIIWDSRVWKLHKAWPRLLAKRTWYRDGYGKRAIHQYAVMAVLEHRQSGHIIRAASWHMPSEIQARNGGPNWRQRDRVEAFWRMSRSLRNAIAATPSGQQFTGMCDCNVSHGRDHSRLLLRGKLTRPSNLMNQYNTIGKKSGWQIDYVMAKRKKPYVIGGWQVLHDLRTDHPSPVVRFVRR